MAARTWQLWRASVPILLQELREGASYDEQKALPKAPSMPPCPPDPSTVWCDLSRGCRPQEELPGTCVVATLTGRLVQATDLLV